MFVGLRDPRDDARRAVRASAGTSSSPARHDAWTSCRRSVERTGSGRVAVHDRQTARAIINSAPHWLIAVVLRARQHQARHRRRILRAQLHRGAGMGVQPAHVADVRLSRTRTPKTAARAPTPRCSSFTSLPGSDAGRFNPNEIPMRTLAKLSRPRVVSGDADARRPT